jgi:hypothetical protein
MSEAWGMSEFLGCQHFSRLSERFSHRSRLCQPHLMEATYDGQNGTFEGALPPSGERKRGRPFRSYLIMKRSTQNHRCMVGSKAFLRGRQDATGKPIEDVISWPGRGYNRCRAKDWDFKTRNAVY